jgi:hypothetical protein
VILLCMLEDTPMQRPTIALIVPLALGFLVAPLAAEAQPPTKVPRIGYLSPGSTTTAGPCVKRS